MAQFSDSDKRGTVYSEKPSSLTLQWYEWSTNKGHGEQLVHHMIAIATEIHQKHIKLKPQEAMNGPEQLPPPTLSLDTL